MQDGDVYIGTNDTVNVKVREAKKPAKVVYVSYVLESGEPLANAIEKIELENGATTFSTSLLKKSPLAMNCARPAMFTSAPTTP